MLGEDALLSLSKLIAGFGRDAINTQCILDENYLQEFGRFVQLVGRLSPDLEPFITPLVPTQQFISAMEFELQLRLRSARETGFEIQALPLNLSFAMRYSATAEHETTLRVYIEQTRTESDKANTDIED